MSAPEQIGKYRIEGQLGQGGMGVVYLARDPVIERTVALKAIVKSSLELPDAHVIVGRFKREAQAAGRLVHPNIVSVFEYGEDSDYAFIAMEFVKGQSLHRLLAARKHLPLDEIRSLLTQLLDALDYSHRHGVVHRDVKPSNILVTDEGRVKVTDFGIARLESSNLTHLGDVLGTPNYMSPEQFQGHTADARSDIYSAGVIAYQLLTGQRPFKGNTASVMRQVLEDLPPSPTEINPELPPDLDAVIHRALAKSPEDRFPSAAAFSRALIDVLQDKPRLDLDLSIHDTSGAGPKLRSSVLAALRRPKVEAGDGAARGEEDAEGREPPAPERAAAGPAASPGAFQEVEAGKGRVLFVDDEERILSALKSIFRHRYHVFTAVSGREAVEFLRRFRVHLVVSDQRMPGMTGVQLLRQVKDMSPNTVRILLTGYSDLAAIAGSINEGEVYRFISKPWDTQELKDTIREAVTIGIEMFDFSGAQSVTVERTDAAILVLDPEPEVFRGIKEIFGRSCGVLHARDVASAIRQLGEREVAVVVADLDFDGEEVGAFCKLLKQEHPQILSVVLTRSSDSEMVIELINQAQVYRFLNKPVNLGVMKGHLGSALARYTAFQKAPTLLKSQQVEEVEGLRETSTARTILDRLKSLRGRIAAVFR